MTNFSGKLILSHGYDSFNFPLKIKNDKITEAAWKNLTKTNTLDEAYILVIQGWINEKM
jgi:hypothetical protein